MRSVENITFGAILSFDPVCVGSPVIIMLQKTVNKQKLRILSSIRDHRKSRETREVTYTCGYTSEHLIPLPIMTELGIKCPLV